MRWTSVREPLGRALDSFNRGMRHGVCRRGTLAVMLLGLGFGRGSEAGIPEPSATTQPQAQPRARRPVAIAFSNDGTRLFVANRTTGSVSVVDAGERRVIAEHEVGQGLAELVPLPGGTRWLALDQDDNAVLLLEEREDKLQVVARRAVKPDPVKLALSPDGSTCFVASRWGRTITLLALDRRPSTLSPVRSIDLPFSPRDMLLVRDGSTLIVADAFGGNLAVIDVPGGSLATVRSLPAHNIRGLALTPDGTTLLLAHQELNPKALAIQDDVQWGALLSNKVRALALDELIGQHPDTNPRPLGTHARVVDLGRTSGDPSALACDRSGRVVLTLGGVDQLVMGVDYSHLEIRVATGRRPTAFALDPAHGQVFVAETLDDTVSVFELKSGKRLARIPLGADRDASLEERGERLFYDARLSRGGWMSCHSCHTDGHSNGLNVDTSGDGDYGAPKRVPTLLGTGTTGPWSWNGRIDRLEEQVHQSAVTTVQGVWPTESEVAELAAFLRTLAPPRPPTTATADRASANRGRTLFEAKCATCHAGPESTSDGLYDVGLADEMGHRRFNPPSLQGVGSRAPLLHDGRAKTLEDVFRKHGHPRNSQWSDGEITDLLHFLESL